MISLFVTNVRPCGVTNNRFELRARENTVSVLTHGAHSASDILNIRTLKVKNEKLAMMYNSILHLNVYTKTFP
jgi:hypothetical protein